ncbi:MAG: amino acid ABC transporter permease, partial [Pseudomonadota bacterium]
HSTALAFLAAFPAWRQKGDVLYYAKYFADKTYNPFIPYPIAAFYFILFTLIIIFLFGLINKRLNRHLAPSDRKPLRYRPQLIR